MRLEERVFVLPKLTLGKESPLRLRGSGKISHAVPRFADSRLLASHVYSLFNFFSSFCSHQAEHALREEIGGKGSSSELSRPYAIAFSAIKIFLVPLGAGL